MSNLKAKTIIFKAVPVIILAVLFIPEKGYSAEKAKPLLIPPTFNSSNEFAAHAEGGSCSSEKCHNNMKRNSPSVHEPAIKGECEKCHVAENYPLRYGVTADQRTLCTTCHRKTGDKIESAGYVHGPIKNNDCTSCHHPHNSDQPYLLRQAYSQLCKSCHKIEGLYSGSFVHKPVKDGNCGLCHDPHVSDYKSRLIDVGVNLCASCHEEVVTGMTQDHVHAPLLKTGCGDCHLSHSGNNRLRLKKSINEICFTCHEEKQHEVQQYRVKHKPALEGLCIACHSPHYSDKEHLLSDSVDLLCYTCHKEAEKRSKRKYKHGPVIQGNCTACHSPHGSDNAYILRVEFPHQFYSPYEEDTYSLCFLCHSSAVVTAENSETVTDFRNGLTNLHRLHVKQEKGRTCRACHDVHASEQEGRIRDTFPYGTMLMPLEYYKTPNGGFCAPGCHKPMTYDRLHEVNNAN